jgi:hypothetical protein
LRKAAELPYEEEPAAKGNWGEDDDPEEYEDVDYEIVSDGTVLEAEPLEQDPDPDKDLWADDENPKPYRAPKVDIPERKRVVEYEEETDY